MSATVDRPAFLSALGRFASGVTVVTTVTGGVDHAMTASAFTSVSLDPPLVGFFPDRKSTSWPQIEAAGHFCVNVMGSDQTDICRAVGAKGDQKFVGVEYTISEHKLPVIANAIASIECRLYSVTEAGDHWFVMGEVLRMESSRDEDPMLFHRGRYGGFAEIL